MASADGNRGNLERGQDTDGEEGVALTRVHERSRAKLTVVIVAACPPPIAGQSVATRMLLDHLSVTGATVDVIDIGRELTSNGVAGFLRRGLSALVWPAKLLRFRLMRAERPVFYLQLGQSTRALVRDLPLLAAAAVLGLPTVVHVHGGAFGVAFANLPAVARHLLKALLARARFAVVLTPGLREMFIGIVAAGVIRVISNGVERALESDARAFQEDRGSVIEVLYLSNLIESKGYVTFLEAARLAQLQQRPYRFVLAGAETNQTTVAPEAYAAANGLRNVEYVGSVGGASKHARLRSADAFVLPTSYPVEGQPIAILEAMHYGLPIVTTSAGGIPDVVGHGRNGLLVPAGSPEAILAALDRLAADPNLRQSITLENRRAARELYTERRHVEQLGDLLEQARC